MISMPITIEQARDAKFKVQSLFKKRRWPAAAFGLGQAHGTFAVKVNLKRSMQVAMPAEIDGVPVIYEVTGDIRKL